MTYGVLALSELVANSILGRCGTGRDIDVGVLGDLLVGLLRSSGSGLK
jgi:hypothetical protein